MGLLGRLKSWAFSQPKVETKITLPPVIEEPKAMPKVELATGPRGEIGRQSRAWRNRNPGNLRPPRTWKPEGVVGEDKNPGGPFVIFGSESHGWQALATRILQLHNSGTRTVEKIIGIWAPPSENRTDIYVSGVAVALGVSPNAEIDATKYDVMVALATAIRRHEGMRMDPTWSQTEMDIGLARAGVKKPT